MSSRTLKKQRVKRVIRAVIVGRAQSGDREYLLFQRSKQSARFPSIWECIGGSLDPNADRRAIHTLIRECSEEAGIRISRIITEVHNETRPWEPDASHSEHYDAYHVTHFLVETPTIKEIIIGREHRGFGWFPGPLVGLMQKIVRNSSCEAIRAVHQMPHLELAEHLTLNPRHR